MYITFFSFFISILWGSIAVIVVYLLRKQYFLVRHFGLMSVLFIYLFCAVRMFIPFEFFFTKEISGQFLNTLYNKLHLEKIEDTKISILIILMFIWAAVAVFLIFHLFVKYHKVMKVIKKHEIVKNKQYNKILKEVIKTHDQQIKINLRCSKDVHIPFCIGFVHKSIVLPDEKYTDTELYYILLHEYTHFVNRDLSVKLLIQIFCCIYWWNPIVYLLRKDLEQALETKCDLHIARFLSKHEKIKYLETIVSILQRASTNNEIKLYCVTSLFNKDHEKEVLKRFKAVIDDYSIKIKNKVITRIWVLSLSILVFVSYLFVIQPEYKAPKEEIGNTTDIFEIHPENAYIEKNTDRTYTLTISNGDSHPIDEERALEMQAQGFKIIEAAF